MGNLVVTATQALQANLKEFTFEAQKYHWAVKGKEFFTLHEFFETIYNWSFASEDVVAELLLGIKSTPLMEIEKIIGLSSIKKVKSDPTLTNESIINACLFNLKTLREKVQNVITASEVIEDDENEKAKYKTFANAGDDLLDAIYGFEWKLEQYKA